MNENVAIFSIFELNEVVTILGGRSCVKLTEPDKQHDLSVAVLRPVGIGILSLFLQP
jgi:hypothetical protein